MAHVYVDTTKQGRERYSGPATYGALGEAAVDLAWVHAPSPPSDDEETFGAWWDGAKDAEWWRPWMGEYRTEAHGVYTSALAQMRKLMTTERMTDDLWQRLVRDEYPEDSHERIVAESERARRVEQEQAEKIRQLEDMLRLANDKMAEQVRQARWEVAEEILTVYAPTYNEHCKRVEKVATRIRDANAPKD